MKKHFLKLSVLALAVSFTSCSDDDPVVTVPTIEIPSITDAQLATDIQTDLAINLSTEVAYYLQQKKDQPTSNRNISISEACDDNGSVSEMMYEGKTYIGYTFDFGTTGCTQADGKVVMGKIKLLTPNTSFKEVIFLFEDYTVDGNKLNGSINSKKEESGTNQAKITISQDLVVNIPVIGEFKRKTSNIVRTYLLGYDTPNTFDDDVFETTGNWVTTFPNGTLNTVNITEKLKTKIECPLKHIQGKMNFTRNENNGSIDFGNGLVCNQTWKITRNGQEYDVTVNK